MATANDFAKIGTIEGVARYVLVRDDGHIASANHEEAVTLSSEIITSGKFCDSLTDDLEGRRYIYCCVERKSGDNILIFSLGRYYLGIIKHTDADPQHLADTIIGFLKSMS